MNLRRIAGLLLALLVLCAAGCSGGEEEAALRTYKLGMTGTDFEVWEGVSERLAEYGIALEILSFNDYVQPNLALAQGELDLNSFQTEIYFDDFKAAHGLDLTNAGYTAIGPMGIYAATDIDMENLPSPCRVAIPNDVTNGGRAIKFLESLGLLTVDPEAGLIPTIHDITGYNHDLEIIEMAATQIPRSLEDLDFAAINNGVAYEAGLLLVEDAIISEDPYAPHMKAYWNMIAVRTEDAEKEDILKIVEVYQSDATREHIMEKFGGQSVPVF